MQITDKNGNVHIKQLRIEKCPYLECSPTGVGECELILTKPEAQALQASLEKLLGVSVVQTTSSLTYEQGQEKVKEVRPVRATTLLRKKPSNEGKKGKFKL